MSLLLYYIIGHISITHCIVLFSGYANTTKAPGVGLTKSDDANLGVYPCVENGSYGGDCCVFGPREGLPPPIGGGYMLKEAAPSSKTIRSVLGCHFDDGPVNLLSDVSLLLGAISNGGGEIGVSLFVVAVILYNRSHINNSLYCFIFWICKYNKGTWRWID